MPKTKRVRVTLSWEETSRYSAELDIDVPGELSADDIAEELSDEEAERWFMNLVHHHFGDSWPIDCHESCSERSLQHVHIKPGGRCDGN